MLRLCLGSFAGGWLLLMLIMLTGRLRWDHPWLWGPPALFMLASFLGLGGWDHAEHRLPLLLTGAAAFCSALAYAVFYFFLFGLTGR